MSLAHHVDVKTEADRDRARIVRTEFLRLVVADERTHGLLFEVWVDRIADDVDAIVSMLDNAAKAAGLNDRSQLTDDNQIEPVIGVAQLRYEACVAKLRQFSLLDEAIGFVVAILFKSMSHVGDDIVDERVPCRAWIGEDLVNIFLAKINARIYGRPLKMFVPLPPTLNVVTAVGRSSEPEKMRRDVRWFYELHIDPKDDDALRRATEEYVADRNQERLAKGKEALRTIDYDRPLNQARLDSSLVRKRTDEVWRLLSLPLPPEQWAKLQQLENPNKFGGGKLIS